jgi:hypothetical protein
MLEMRAALSLSRLLIRSNRRADARLILKETYAWFTEGFDSLELKAARSLMEELGAASEPDQKRHAPALSR